MVCAVKQARNKDDSTDKRHQGQREAETRQVVPGCVERELGSLCSGQNLFCNSRELQTQMAVVSTPH